MLQILRLYFKKSCGTSDILFLTMSSMALKLRTPGGVWKVKASMEGDKKRFEVEFNKEWAFAWEQGEDGEVAYWRRQRKVWWRSASDWVRLSGPEYTAFLRNWAEGGGAHEESSEFAADFFSEIITAWRSLHRQDMDQFPISSLIAFPV
jgi:hypothetical protein